MKSKRHSLFGIEKDLDIAIRELGFYANIYREVHPAAAGDVSKVLSINTSIRLKKKFRSKATKWFSMSEIEKLASLRRDGRTGYRSENVKNEEFFTITKSLGGRVLLITCTGSQLPAISETIWWKEDGKLLNLVEVSKDGSAIRVLYGNHEFGTIPSIELHVHMLASGIGINQGTENPAVVHAHAYHLNLLGMNRLIRGDFKSFNAVIYAQIEGLNRNVPGLIGVIPYQPSGSAALVEANLKPLTNHQLVLWMNHGFIVRSFSIARAYALLAYAEQAARAALDIIRYGGVGLPMRSISDLLKKNNLLGSYRKLKLRGAPQK